MNLVLKLKALLFDLVEPKAHGSKAGVVFNYFIVGLIVANLVALVLSSFQDLYREWEGAFNTFELGSVAVFTVEYLVRIFTSDLHYPDKKHPYLTNVFSVMSLVDLAAILPFYLPFFLPIDLRFLRILRLLRLVRIFKLTRYIESMNIVVRVLKREKDILLTTLAMILVLLLVASCLMYNIENEAQPDKFPNIVAAMWWAVATLTTVGYGDIYPITPLGKLLAGVIAVLGIGIVALPTGIISSGFIGELNRNRHKPVEKCPHCGKDLEP